MDSNQNKVILIGGNHHNGLGLVRSFGRKGISPYGIIIGKDAEHSFVRKSRYWKKTWAVKDEETALKILLANFDSERLKPMIIPWSDGAAEALDLNYDLLKDIFILPSINERQGAIVELMNKEAQIDFAEKRDLKMLTSRIIDIDHYQDAMLAFPIILKPVTSIEGGKNDMSICFDRDYYNKSIEKLKKKGFRRILAQKYLPDRKEYVLTGAISQKRYSFSVVRHIRQWPPKFGTGSFSETVTNKRIDSFCSDLLQKISEYGYRGTIDFELFESDSGELFLNEINWRSSGRNFISKCTGVESAYIYYCDCVGKDIKTEIVNKKHVYSMNDATDFKHILNKDITLKQWLSDLKKTESFSIWDLSDIKPSITRLNGMAVKALKGKVGL